MVGADESTELWLPRYKFLKSLISMMSNSDLHNYQNAFKNEVNAKAGFETDLWSARFSGSVGYQEAQNATTLNEQTILESVANCIEYNAKIADIIKVTSLTTFL